MKVKFKKIALLHLLILISCSVYGQQMSLVDAISKARAESVSAIEARSSFISSFWAWRSYQASLLPSLYLYGNLAQFDRSQVLLQDYESGQMHYVRSFNMQNSLGVMASQNISLTGGTLSLYSDLSRIDQFGQSPYSMWYSQPITLRYSQPLFSFNQIKWSRKISPKEYEAAKRQYLEKMEDVNLETVQSYFQLLGAQMTYDASIFNCDNTKSLMEIARQRLKLGSITRDEYLQLDLRMLNDSIQVNEHEVILRKAQMKFGSLLGIADVSGIVPVEDEVIPSITMDYDFVREKMISNSSFTLKNEIDMLSAQSDVAKAKADRGISMQLSARFGLNSTSQEFKEAYHDILDQEVLGLSFSIPIFDWGQGKGKIKKAQAAAEVVEAQIRQAETDLDLTIFTAVGQFNNQRQQCMASKRAKCVSEERYTLVMERFKSGSATVTDLNTARSDYDTARQKYISDIGDFWSYYYTLRKLTLFDFIENIDLDVSFEEMVR